MKIIMIILIMNNKNRKNYKIKKNCFLFIINDKLLLGSSKAHCSITIMDGFLDFISKGWKKYLSFN